MSEGKLLNTSIAKAFRILDCFTSEQPELGVSEIARELEVNKSTVYRLLATLQNLNVLEQNDENQKYRLGLKLYAIGNRVDLYQSFVLKAHPILEEVAFRYHETVHLGVFEDGQVFYLDKVQGRLGLQINTQIGSYRPLHCTGLGKLILANLPKEKRNELFRQQRVVMTKNTIVSKDALKKELKAVRASGYALDNEEYELGLICLAVPIFDGKGMFIGGLSVSGPSTRFPFDRIQEYVNELTRQANRIGQLIWMN